MPTAEWGENLDTHKPRSLMIHLKGVTTQFCQERRANESSSPVASLVLPT